MKQRLLSVTKKYAIILSIGFAYLLWVLFTDIKIPCIFNLVFHLECPGCGITRMIVAIARLDFLAAFYFNPFIFVSFPLILLLIVYPEIRYVKYGSYSLGRLKPLVWIELAAALIFGVLRNIL